MEEMEDDVREENASILALSRESTFSTLLPYMYSPPVHLLYRYS